MKLICAIFLASILASSAAIFPAPTIDVYSNSVRKGSVKGFDFTDPASITITGGRAIIDPGGGGSGVSDSTLNTASNVLRSTSIQTFDTIAAMIAASPATNSCYVKSHSGTNGVGGDLFELRHTNGFATNRGTIFASTAPKKFWFRVFDGQITPQMFGAKGDESNDDTVPWQDCLNYLTNNFATSMRVPIGAYKITSTLTITNHEPGNAWRIVGEAPMGGRPAGAVLKWYGSSGGTLLNITGARNSTLDSLIFSGRGLAKYNVKLDATTHDGGADAGPGEAGIEFYRCYFGGTVGAGSTDVIASHVGGSGTAQVSEIAFHDCNFGGSFTTDHAFMNLEGFNCKNFAFYDCRSSGYSNAFNFNSGSSVVIFDNMVGGYCRTNIVTSSGVLLLINGWYDEGSSNFLHQSSSGANHTWAEISSLEWTGSAFPSSGDRIMYIEGSLILKNSFIANSRAAGAQPNIVLGHPQLMNPPDLDFASSIFSVGNTFYNCTVPPFYGNGAGLGADSTNNWLGYSYDLSVNNKTNVAMYSINDKGGTIGTVYPFKAYDRQATQYDPFFSPTIAVRTATPTNALDVNGSFGVRGTNIFTPDINSNTNDSTAVASVRVNAGGKWSVGPLSSGSGSGEANTGSNLGAGLNTFDSKSSVDFRFNTFSNAGDGITISSNLNLFTINVNWARVMSQTNGAALSNLIFSVAAALTNAVKAEGALSTNYTDARAVALSNLSYAIGTASTNYANATFVTLSTAQTITGPKIMAEPLTLAQNGYSGPVQHWMISPDLVNYRLTLEAGVDGAEGLSWHFRQTNYTDAAGVPVVWTNVLSLYQGRVGVGIYAPAAKLDVLNPPGSTVGPIFHAGTNATHGLTVQTNGRVGLGTNNPQAALHVGNGSAGTAQIDGGLTLPSLTAIRPLILNGSGNVTNATGTPDGTKFLRDDGTLAVPSSGGSSITPFVRIADDGSSGSTNYTILTDTNIMYAAQNRPTFKFTNSRNGAYAVFLITNEVGTGISVSNVGGTNNIVWRSPEQPRANWDGVTANEYGNYTIRLLCTATNILGWYESPQPWFTLAAAGSLSLSTNVGTITVSNNMTFGSASLNFPSTLAGSFSDLPITVTGVTSNGCHVSLSKPWQSTSGGGVFDTYNSNDTVYVRFANNNLTLAIDPNPGTFSVMVSRAQ